MSHINELVKVLTHTTREHHVDLSGAKILIRKYETCITYQKLFYYSIVIVIRTTTQLVKRCRVYFHSIP